MLSPTLYSSAQPSDALSVLRGRDLATDNLLDPVSGKLRMADPLGTDCDPYPAGYLTIHSETARDDKLPEPHGDHIGGERDAAQALLRGEADAACCIDGNHLLFTQEAILPAGATRVVAHTPAYDHCNFTVLDGAPVQHVHRFRELLLGMSYSDPEVRPLLDMEGLKQWHPGRTEGYAALDAAVRRFGTVDEFVKTVVAQCK